MAKLTIESWGAVGLLGGTLIVLMGALGCSTPYSAEDDDHGGDGPTNPVDPPVEPPRFLPENVVSAEVPPPPLQGGTLLVIGERAVAADPDRDLVFVVDLENERVEATIELEAGALPGRVIAGPDESALVALRGEGRIIAIDLAEGRITSTLDVCPTPNGLVLDDEGTLHVACDEGLLVSIPWTAEARTPAEGESRTLDLGGDLRDVVAYDGRLFVSQFRSAKVLILDDTGALDDVFNLTYVNPQDTPREPHVAWRLKADPVLGVAMMHQLHRTDPLPSAAPYYNDPCRGPVTTMLTHVAGPGAGVTQQIPGTLVPDFDIHAGKVASVLTSNAFDPHEILPDVVETELAQQSVAFCGGTLRSISWSETYQVTAIAYHASGTLYIQSREPAVLLHKTEENTTVIELSAESREDTGFALFHADNGGGMTCASCHPGGREDGHVWSFEEEGIRRTQSLAGTLAHTAPYHWDGRLDGLDVLMQEVFTDRMQGPELDRDYRDAFSKWLLAIPAPTQRIPADVDAVDRGRALFEDPAVGCADCHDGPAFTNNDTVDVGTGEALQVPSLLGIGKRAPFMHDGCAATLADRFDPVCGGASHGDVSHLAPTEIADLIAYLEAL